MSRVGWFGTVALIAFVLNGVWEWGQLSLNLYTGYEGLFGPYPVWIVAALGDALYTLVVVGALALLKKERSYALLSFGGLLVAIAVEYKAILLHRWAYTAAMPTIFGLGLSPLLQMALLVPASVYLAGAMWRARRRASA